MKFSFIVAESGEGAFSRECLESVSRQMNENADAQAEVVLLSSSDACAIPEDVVSDDGAWKQVVAPSGQTGRFELWNQGIDNAVGDYCIFLSGDETLPSGFLANAALLAGEGAVDAMWGPAHETGSGALSVQPADFSGGVWDSSNQALSFGQTVSGKVLRTDIIRRFNIRFRKGHGASADYLFASLFALHANEVRRLSTAEGGPHESVASADRFSHLASVCQVIVDNYATKRFFTHCSAALCEEFVRQYLEACAILQENAAKLNELRREMESLLTRYFKDEWHVEAKRQLAVRENGSQLAALLANEPEKLEKVPKYEGEEPLFTVVMPVYNVEEYLEEAIESIISQSIGFSNIQLILVNDGSADGSGAICERYAEKYGNVEYYPKENGGVSSARNLGLSHAKGRYINFLDPDDKWSKGALRGAYVFFEHNPGIKIVACKLKFFDAREGNHPLNYKFKRNRIIDITEQPGYPQLSFASIFVETAFMKKYRFNESVAISEDAILLAEMLTDCKKYGTLRRPVYWYRKRRDESSAIAGALFTDRYYFGSTSYFYQACLEAGSKDPNIYWYMQYLVMYDLQWRVKARDPGYLPPEEKARYRTVIVDLLKQVEDCVILQQRRLGTSMKIYTLALKYGVSFDEFLDHGESISSDYAVWISRNEPFVRVSFMSINHGVLKIEGAYDCYSIGVSPEMFVEICYCDGSVVRVGATVGNIGPKGVTGSFFEDYYTTPTFSVDCEIKNGIESMNVIFAGRRGAEKAVDQVRYARFAHVSNSLEYAGYEDSGYYVYASRHGLPSVLPAKSRNALRQKKLHAGALCAEEGGQEIYRLARKAAWRRKFPRRKIWLISDRITSAGDNGQALFEYLARNKMKGIRPIFVISETSPDFSKMKEVGEVVSFEDPKYKELFLQADVVASSAAEGYVTNAFGDDLDLAKPFYRFKYAFLQHGVTKDDLSAWLFRGNKNISLFVTSAARERDSIVENADYAYGEDVVKLTGFPRHDKLIAGAGKVDKIVTIMPTWRKWITGPYDQETGTREKNPDFRETEFFKFYSALLSDERLHASLKKGGYKMRFVLHPSLAQERDCFESIPSIEIADEGVSYTHEFQHAAVMVTDYSSVAFDFALLKKPVVYTQFDREEFFEEHTYKEGYFSYIDDGFGPVFEDVDSTVDAIVDLIADECKMPDEYKRRVDDFYGKQPPCRCLEVANALKEL